MKSMTFHVAGGAITVEGNPEVTLLNQQSYSQFLSPAKEEPTWGRIRFVEHLPEEGGEGTLLYTFRFQEAGVTCYFHRQEMPCTKYRLEMVPDAHSQQGVRLQYSYGRGCVDIEHTHDHVLLHFAMWFAFSLLAVPYGRAPIHASAIVWKERTVLFLGESGTGKSTHARLWLQHIPGSQLLNDDSPILTVDDEKVLAYGSPWSGKSPCYHPEGFPLQAIVRLSQAQQNHISRLGPAAAVAALHPSLPPALSRDTHYEEALHAIVRSVLPICPVYHLACRPDADAAHLCCHTLYTPLP